MAERFVCAAIKPVAPVLDVDWTTGRASLERRHLVRTAADAAACAVAASLAASLGLGVVVATVAGPAAHEVLRAASAEAAARALRVVVGVDDDTSEPAEQWPSDVVAGALATVTADAAVVVCGDASGDRGSGTVPARLAQLLGIPQALSLRTVSVQGGRLVGTRRLDGGRRERLVLDAPCVLSVEAGVASPTRAPLAAVLDSSVERTAEVVRVGVPAGARRGDAPGTVVGPYRPRPSALPWPTERDPVRRAVELAGSLVVGEPPEVLRADPDAAAAAILERLARWGLR